MNDLDAPILLKYLTYWRALFVLVAVVLLSVSREVGGLISKRVLWRISSCKYSCYLVTRGSPPRPGRPAHGGARQLAGIQQKLVQRGLISTNESC